MKNINTGLKYNYFLFYLVLGICFSISVSVRFNQFEIWGQNTELFFVEERPLMTTLDAPYWLRMARDYNEGNFDDKDRLRGYPDNTKTLSDRYAQNSSIDETNNIDSKKNNIELTQVSKKTKYSDVPLISLMIAKFTPFFGNNYYLTGTLLVPFFASLFIIPLGIYFLIIKIPLSGLMGGLIGTFSMGYYTRSSIGRIDTDMLNLFFPTLAALMILQASRVKTEHFKLIYSIGSGLIILFFQWWYEKPGFILAYFIVIVLSMLINKVRLRTIFLSSLLFIIFANPFNFLKSAGSMQSFINTYFSISVSTDNKKLEQGNKSASFPNAMTTISEVDKVPMNTVLKRVLSNSILAWFGLISFLFLVILKWKAFLPLLPLIGLGLLSFISSNRFIMFLAPFIGIGLGWLLHIVIDCVFLIINKKIKVIEKKMKNFYLQKWLKQSLLYISLGFSFWLISDQTAISYVPRPSINPKIYETFYEVKKRIPSSSAVLTWWDYGYAITDLTRLATFHDGGNQTNPKTYFIARSLISNKQEELFDITQYLSTKGNRGIFEKNTSAQSLLNAVLNPQETPWDPIYLFFTADMTGKFGAISKIGSWNLEKGGSKPNFYQNLNCNKITFKEIKCIGADIDLQTGLINNKIPLKRLLFIRDGKIIREKNFAESNNFTLQLIVVGRKILDVQLINENVFNSNYNQMFFLGNYSKDMFEETFNAFPFARLFKIKY